MHKQQLIPASIQWEGDGSGSADLKCNIRLRKKLKDFILNKRISKYIWRNWFSNIQLK